MCGKRLETESFIEEARGVLRAFWMNIREPIFT